MRKWVKNGINCELKIPTGRQWRKW